MKDDFLLDGHKLLWHFDQVKKVNAGEMIAPIYIEVSPVSYCNHKCNFCGKDFVQSPDFTINTEKFNSFISYAGKNGLKSIMFAGEGEPLLHPEIDQLLKICKHSGVDVSITTNGAKGNAQIWNSILPDLTWIRFSVNGGSSETYAKVHKTINSEFEKVCKNITEAVAIKRSQKLKVTIGVQLVVLEENKHELEKVINIFSEIGVDYVSFKPFSKNPQMLSTKNEIYNEEEIKKIEGLHNPAGVGPFKTKVLSRIDAFQKYSLSEIKYPHCHSLPFWAYITASGDFYTCPIHIGNEKFNVGNINKVEPEIILFGKKREESISFGKNSLDVKNVCRVNCRMARANEFLEEFSHQPEHINFI